MNDLWHCKHCDEAFVVSSLREQHELRCTHG